jgi:hypothetical protein
MTWGDFLKDYQSDRVTLFSETFLRRWAHEPWEPNVDDRKAAGKLHTQLTSRISTQRLGYLEGVETTALESLYALFQSTRDIADEFPACRHFEALSWDVLNVQVRPFTAKWHQESERGLLAALDATDGFRAELNDLQPVLRRFDDLLIHLRDGHPPPPAVEGKNDRQNMIGHEMDSTLPWGILPQYSGIDTTSTVRSSSGMKSVRVEEINSAEREAIRARRNYYGIDDKAHAIGLALSGGGIRSATFSLGVLVALARRGVLPQIDYLSTVSGGGYLGSFLSAFLNSPASAEIGLRPDQMPFVREGGEAAALRHIRHYSKYLAIGSAGQKAEMITAQLFGMVLNGLAIVLTLLVAVLVEHLLRSHGLEHLPNVATEGALGALGLGVMTALISSRLRGKWQHYADRAALCLAVPLLLILAWTGLEQAHVWWEQHQDWSLSGKKTWLLVAGTIPLLTSALSRTIGKFLLKRAGIVLLVLSGIAAPVFLFGVYLALYGWGGGAEVTLPILGKSTRFELEILVAIFGLLAYLFLLDINFTSPHRYYRDKLAHAYLIQLRKGKEKDEEKDREKKTPDAFTSAVSLRLSQLGTESHRGPYHLLNCALNVPGSNNPTMQGRLTDFFLFSPKYCGSPLTGYQPTVSWENSDPHLDLATAMAISGAAAAPQMGLATIKSFSFWLALLNVRLGYWSRKPGTNPWLSGPPGLRCLLQEMRGTMDETLPWLNVSDGGHIENLGVYELLRRRCKYIIAIDGEHDPKMTFHGLTTLQRLADIDLGVKIDLKLDDLRLNAQGLSRSHFRFCRIRYPKDVRGSEELFGYLLYMKLSLTGNESEFIRRYRLDQPMFPHHSTADQFFTESQFEAYRSLGEHIGDKLFLRAIVGEMAEASSVEVESWFGELGTNLLEPLSRAT